MLNRIPEVVREDNYELIVLKPVDANQPLIAGFHFISIGAIFVAENDEVWVTSTA